MDKKVVATGVAEKLIEAEFAIDAAMVDAAQLIESVLQARRELHVSSTSIDVAVARATEAVAALAEARRATGASHTALSHALREMGLDERTIGVFMPKLNAQQETAIRAAS